MICMLSLNFKGLVICKGSIGNSGIPELHDADIDLQSSCDRMYFQT